MSQIPRSILRHIEIELSAKITGNSSIGGGCINQASELITDKGNFFMKWNTAQQFPGMFTSEARGLRLLQSKKCIDIPGVIVNDEVENYQFIVLEFIRGRNQRKNFWQTLGERLAALHRNTYHQFGLDHDNYIGALPQQNTWADSWPEFFIHQRLDVQLALYQKNNTSEVSLRKRFELLYRKLPDLLPEEKPALLHGDLWSGNLMVNEAGEPALIDPAVYYGHREAELAFTRLFGGFNAEFYASYHDSFPFEPGIDSRIDIYNLYPLMVHANLFGGGYINQVNSIIQKFE